MDNWFWIIVVILAVGVIAYFAIPAFKGKADKYIDKDGDGKPFS